MRVYRIAFFNQGKVYEIYARRVHQGELYGFVEIEDILFGEGSSVLVDPAEERLQSEFKGVQRCMVPIHAVVRIDEVAKEGQAKIHDVGKGSNITPFPSAPAYGPGKDKGP